MPSITEMIRTEKALDALHLLDKWQEKEKEKKVAKRQRELERKRQRRRVLAEQLRLAREKRGTATTAQKKIMEVANELQEPFTKFDLAVKCWLRHPEDFGVPGYNHPNTNNVFAYLYGTRGLIKKGLLVRVGDQFIARTSG